MSCKCDTYGKNSKGYKITLCEDEMPRKYYNILPDLPTPLDPPMNPGTGKPAKTLSDSCYLRMRLSTPAALARIWSGSS